MLKRVKYKRPDGTFVGIVNGLEYHVIPGEPYWAAALEMGEHAPREHAPEPRLI